ncbi:hypothetical protein TWF694_006586 [Orbilia ellipsospora]|uniref:Folate receptor-like domain-containing protein n=1 Tax=Orbilia ellipsospora TaxID=2528407 RepID=A0AAV9XSA8_9PEZI
MGAASFILRFSFALLLLNSAVLAGRPHRKPPAFSKGESPAPPRLRERQAATPTATSTDPGKPISWDTFPYVSEDDCTSYCVITDDYNYIGCEPTEVPCTNDPKKKCTTVDHACFCNNPTALDCGYYCDWFDYFRLEDWFSDVCPEVPKINFDGLPRCAQQCMRTAVSNWGCVSFTRSCFCEEQWLFGCGDSCNSKDKQQILSWYGTQCLLTPDEVTALDLIDPSASAASATFGSASATSSGDPKDGPGVFQSGHHKLKWYEIYGLIMFLLTLIFVTTLYVFIWKAEVKDIWKNNKARVARSKHASRNASVEKLSSPRKSKESARKSIEKVEGA